MGHGRQAAIGDAISNLFSTQGWSVHREFYYNDAGVQIDTLTKSTQLRAKGFKPGDDCWPTDSDNPLAKNFYNGDYIADIAEAFKAKATVKADDREFTANGDVDDYDNIRQFAVAYLRNEQDKDLQAFNLHFDQYYPGIEPLHQRPRRGHGEQARRQRQDLRTRRRAVAQEHGLRRRQGPRHAQERRHLHLLRA